MPYPRMQQGDISSWAGQPLGQRLGECKGAFSFAAIDAISSKAAATRKVIPEVPWDKSQICLPFETPEPKHEFDAFRTHEICNFMNHILGVKDLFHKP